MGYPGVYLLLSLILICVLTHREHGGDGSGTPDTTVEPSGGLVGLTKAYLLLNIVKYHYDGSSAPCCYNTKARLLYECLHVAARGLAAVGSPQPIA